MTKIRKIIIRCTKKAIFFLKIWRNNKLTISFEFTEATPAMMVKIDLLTLRIDKSTTMKTAKIFSCPIFTVNKIPIQIYTIFTTHFHIKKN